MARYVKHFKKSYITDREFKISFELFKLVCQALLFSHFAACCWWFVGRITENSWIDATSYYDKEQDLDLPLRDIRYSSEFNFVKYSYAYYWAVVKSLIVILFPCQFADFFFFCMKYTK